MPEWSIYKYSLSLLNEYLSIESTKHNWHNRGCGHHTRQRKI